MTTSRYRKLKVGDVIFSYKKGIFKVTGINRRLMGNSPRDARSADYFIKTYGETIDVHADDAEIGSIIESEMILNGKFKMKNGKDSCDEAYCAKVSEEWVQKQIDDIHTNMELVRSLLI